MWSPVYCYPGFLACLAGVPVTGTKHEPAKNTVTLTLVLYPDPIYSQNPKCNVDRLK